MRLLYLKLIDNDILNLTIIFSLHEMLTNAPWLPTTVLLTPIVQILWDHSSAITNLVILEMVEHVKVSANWSFRSGKWTVTQVKCTMPLAHILKNVETNRLIMTLEETTRETDRQIHR